MKFSIRNNLTIVLLMTTLSTSVCLNALPTFDQCRKYITSQIPSARTTIHATAAAALIAGIVRFVTKTSKPKLELPENPTLLDYVDRIIGQKEKQMSPQVGVDKNGLKEYDSTRIVFYPWYGVGGFIHKYIVPSTVALTIPAAMLTIYEKAQKWNTFKVA